MTGKMQGTLCIFLAISGEIGHNGNVKSQKVRDQLWKGKKGYRSGLNFING